MVNKLLAADLCLGYALENLDIPEENKHYESLVDLLKTIYSEMTTEELLERVECLEYNRFQDN